MRRGAGMSSVGPASCGGEVAAGSPGARAGDSMSRGSGFIAGSPGDVFGVAESPPARDRTPQRYRILESGRSSLSLAPLSVALGLLSPVNVQQPRPTAAAATCGDFP